MGSPFELAHGISFQTLSTAGPKCYLNSTPGGATYDISISVYMTDVLDFERTPGCFWEIHTIKDFTMRFETKSESSEKRFLNSSGAAPKEKSVYLSEDKSAGDGSHWTSDLLPDASFSFICHSPSGQKYLTAAPTAAKKESVFLSKTTEDMGTHWHVLATSYAGDKIERIIRAVYPSVPIDPYESDAIYASLDYNRLHTIWNDSQLGDKNPDDYADHLKTVVSKHPNIYNLPNVKGSLCGIMKGTIESKPLAVNFTIDPFVKLILFDPQDGQKIPTNKFTPTSCEL